MFVWWWNIWCQRQYERIVTKISYPLNQCLARYGRGILSYYLNVSNRLKLLDRMGPICLEITFCYQIHGDKEWHLTPVEEKLCRTGTELGPRLGFCSWLLYSDIWGTGDSRNLRLVSKWVGGRREEGCRPSLGRTALPVGSLINVHTHKNLWSWSVMHVVGSWKAVLRVPRSYLLLVPSLRM